MSLEEVQEFSDNYSQQLRAMKRPAKEEINALTMVASDYVDCPKFALAVVQVIERCVDEVIHDAFASCQSTFFFVLTICMLLPLSNPLCCCCTQKLANRNVMTLMCVLCV